MAENGHSLIFLTVPPPIPVTNQTIIPSHQKHFNITSTTRKETIVVLLNLYFGEKHLLLKRDHVWGYKFQIKHYTLLHSSVNLSGDMIPIRAPADQ